MSTNCRVTRQWPAVGGNVRRWDVARTHRLNSSHWSTALGQSLNADLLAYLDTVRNRCEYEGSANPTIDGMIFTHQNDIVGRDGPTLQVQSDSDSYNDWLEFQWQDWFRSPLPNPRISGAQWLRLTIRTLHQAGEYLAQKVTKRNVTTPCAMRIKPIHPSRLQTPPMQAGNPRVIMGIELSEDGEPQHYYIQEPNTHGGFQLPMGEPTRLSPDDIIHQFILREEDQIRGCPWLAASLQPAADLKDYDYDVSDCARQAANTGVYWYSDSPEARFLAVSEQLELERGTQATGPPGWKPAMLTPQQPSTQYPDYRRERQGDLGRPIGMPAMMVRLDASRHNYSSARFDDQGWGRAIQAIQYWISGTPKATGMLSELVDDVDREASLFFRARREAIPLRPPEVSYEWTWPVRPHVDPQKEGLGERIGIENGTLAFADACASRGSDEDSIIAKQERTNQKLAAKGMPPLPPIGAYPKSPVDFTGVYVEEEDRVNNVASEKEPANA